MPAPAASAPHRLTTLGTLPSVPNTPTPNAREPPKMATHRFRPTRYYNVIGTAEPVLRVASGDTLIADTIDASGLDAREMVVAERPNPMTGPFFIEGAEPGDTLAVRIDRLTPSRATGWTYSPLAVTVLDPAAIPDRPATERAVWNIDQGAGTIGFDCSGLMLYMFAGVGIKLDHYSGSQYNAGRKVPSAQMRRGDMIFYGPNASQHVAMFLGNGQMLEAPYTGSVVKISPVRTSGMTPFVTRMIEW